MENAETGRRIKYIRAADYSPEKAGVGGSIPSLATRINHLQACMFDFGCNWLHFRNTFSYPGHHYCTTHSPASAVNLRTALRCDSGTNC